MPTQFFPEESESVDLSTESDEIKDGNYSGTLYATPKGKKYHFLPNCAGENSVEISWDEAEERGLEACKRCAY